MPADSYNHYAALVSRAIDVVAIVLAGWLSYCYLFSEWYIESERYTWAIIAGVLMVLAILPGFGIYRSWRGQLRATLVFRLALGYSIIALFVTAILFFFNLSLTFSRQWIGLWLIAAFMLSILLRFIAFSILASLRLQGRNRRRVVLIGDISSCKSAFKNLQDNKSLGFEVSRILVTNTRLGKSLHRYPGVIDNYEAGQPLSIVEDEVWICLPLSSGSEAQQILRAMGHVTANVRLLPTMQDLLLINHNISNIAGLHLVDVSCSPMSGVSRFLKRSEDIVLSLLILILTLPVLIGVGVGVKLSSPGPILYRQKRVSWNGKPFDIIKFRSMPVDVEQDDVRWGASRTKIKTRFGAFIRRTNLDELPQFFNALKGDMSVVGPRPERTVFVERFKGEIPGYMQKHMVKAGITGWAQIHGWRGDTSLQKRIEMDLWYIENWSLWLDLRIIVMTLWKGFMRRKSTDT